MKASLCRHLTQQSEANFERTDGVSESQSTGSSSSTSESTSSSSESPWQAQVSFLHGAVVFFLSPRGRDGRSCERVNMLNVKCSVACLACWLLVLLCWGTSNADCIARLIRIVFKLISLCHWCFAELCSNMWFPDCWVCLISGFRAELFFMHDFVIGQGWTNLWWDGISHGALFEFQACARK